MTDTPSCTSCGSTSVQKASHVYEMGSVTQETTGMAGGVAFRRDGITPVVAQHRSTSHSISALAARLAPPKTTNEEETLRGLYIGIAAAVLGLLLFLFIRSVVANDASFYMSAQRDAQRGMVGLFGLIAALVGTGMALFHGAQLNGARDTDAANHKHLQMWNRTWVCHTCGSTFERGGPSAQSLSPAMRTVAGESAPLRWGE